MTQDNLGDRMKSYESINNIKLMNFLPVYARVDGRKFSSYTKSFDKPFDKDISNSMISTAEYLVEKTHADFAFTQSDEISLFWKNGKPIENFMFGGRVMKMATVLAGSASSNFSRKINDISEKGGSKVPHFDTRVCQVPNLIELYNKLVWRQNDAMKNAVSSKAHGIFGHKSLQGVKDEEKRSMIISELDVESIHDAIEDMYFYGVASYKEMYTIEDNIVRSKIVSKPIPFSVSEMMSSHLTSENDDETYEDAFEIIKYKMQ